MLTQIIPVVMSGGAGTGLWPLSRESMPKQLVPLLGGETTFQQVLTCISDRELFARPIVITSADLRFVVAEQLCERGLEADVALEPARRDSGPTVAVAAVLAMQRSCSCWPCHPEAPRIPRRLLAGGVCGRRRSGRHVRQRRD